MEQKVANIDGFYCV